MKRITRIFLSIIILTLGMIHIASCDILDMFVDEGHSCDFLFERVESELSCTTDGIIIRSCICGRETTSITPAGGHVFTDWETSAEPSCKKNGLKSRECTVCGESEKHIIQRLAHKYDITDEKLGETIYNRYTCLDCGESFLIDSGVTLPDNIGEVWLTDREGDFSFVVISVENEDYIRRHLTIRNLLIGDSEPIDYTLTDLGEGRWLVTASEEYTPGESYVVNRDMGVFFEDYGFNNLIFSIYSEDMGEVELKEDIVYVGALEKESPGYYPFSVEYSSGSGGYFISLEKSDGLYVGDLICVGKATDAEDLLLNGIGTNIFGRIRSITHLTDGRSLIMLDPLTLDGIFDAIDIYDSSIQTAEALHPNASFEAKFLATLLSDPRFADTLMAFYDTGLEFLTDRGLTTTYLDAGEMISMIAMNSIRECEIYETEDGRGALRALTEITVTVKIPALLGKNEIGSLCTEIVFTAEITEGNLTLKLAKDPITDISIDISSKMTGGIDFISYADIDYAATTELFLKENETGLIHRIGCESMVGRSQDVDISALISEGASLCQVCDPMALIDSLLIIDGEGYHINGCELISQNDQLIYTENSPHVLEERGILPCPECMKDEYKSEFVKQFEVRLEELSTTEYDLPDIPAPTMVIAAYAMSASGIDRAVLEISMEIRFDISPSAEYSYKRSFDISQHYRLSSGEIITHSESKVGRGAYAPALSTTSKVYICGYELLTNP